MALNDPTRPYLSVVATARNDDHGINLLGRVQTFVNSLIGQAKRHSLPIELLLVDWNPPPDRLPLAEVIHWPADASPCTIRVLTVSPDLHSRYAHADALPLYQMIAKNAGIRRATGDFILATNIDILFSDELMELIAARRLDPGRMYRLDRTDVAAEVPVDAPVPEQLEYCRTHRIRINARDGTFPLTPEGLRARSPVDVVPPDAGILFGEDWRSAEQHAGHVFRWAGDEPVLYVQPSETARILAFDCVPGPATGFGAFILQVLDANGQTSAEAHVAVRSMVRVRVPAGAKSVALRVVSTHPRTFSQGRVLNFSVSQCAWRPCPPDAPPIAVVPRPYRWTRAGRTAFNALRLFWSVLRGKAPPRIGLPIPPRVLERLQLRTESNGISVALRKPRLTAAPPLPAPADLHTNACGDFTLLHRDRWFDLRGYPEFDLYSMNIDALFCYMAHYGGARELVLPDPVRVYHIEHSAGSGWTPEGENLLYQRLAAKGIPWLEFSDVLAWAAQMERLHSTVIFNREDWGLGEFSLAETHPGREKHP